MDVINYSSLSLVDEMLQENNKNRQLLKQKIYEINKMTNINSNQEDNGDISMYFF